MSFRFAVSAACAALFAFPALAEIEVHDAYARSSGPMAQAGAAFMVIHNHAGPDDRLVGALSDAAARVELHTHEADAEGVMRMIHVEEGFALPSDGEIVMQRGGHHVMFMGLVEPWEQGDLIPLTLVFESGAEIAVEVPVDLMRDEAMGQGPMEHGTMEHGAMGHGEMNHGN